MAKRKFLKPLFITLGCALVAGTAGALIYLNTVNRTVQNKNDSIVDNISFNDATTIFGKENVQVNDNGIAITKFQPQKNGDGKFDELVLPSKIDNKDVTYSDEYYKEMKKYFQKNGTNGFDSSKTSSIKKLYIGDEKSYKHLSVIDLADNIPTYLSGLEYVEVGAGAKNIPSGFFKSLKQLKKVNISTSIQSIGYQAFQGCTSLTEVNFKGSDNKIWIDSAVFTDCPSLKIVNFGSIENFDYKLAKLPEDKGNVNFWNLWWLFKGSGSKENKIVITSKLAFKTEITKISDYLKEKGQDVKVDENINFNVVE